MFIKVYIVIYSIVPSLFWEENASNLDMLCYYYIYKYVY